jgi:hypothetical protein
MPDKYYLPLSADEVDGTFDHREKESEILSKFVERTGLTESSPHYDDIANGIGVGVTNFIHEEHRPQPGDVKKLLSDLAKPTGHKVKLNQIDRLRAMAQDALYFLTLAGVSDDLMAELWADDYPSEFVEAVQSCASKALEIAEETWPKEEAVRFISREVRFAEGLADLWVLAGKELPKSLAWKTEKKMSKHNEVAGRVSNDFSDLVIDCIAYLGSTISLEAIHKILQGRKT